MICSGWCYPLFIYIGLCCLMLIMNLYFYSKNPELHSDRHIFMSLFYQFIWMIVLYLLCKSCHKNIAWFLVLIPLIFILVILFYVFDLLFTVIDNKMYH